jgi:pimeloyl-ACP methyl ester carboxylesterase
VLYLRGEDDGFVTPASVEEIAHLNAATEVVTLPGPHMVLQANPRKSAAAIRNFLHGCRGLGIGSAAA